MTRVLPAKSPGDASQDGHELLAAHSSPTVPARTRCQERCQPGSPGKEDSRDLPGHLRRSGQYIHTCYLEMACRCGGWTVECPARRVRSSDQSGEW